MTEVEKKKFIESLDKLMDLSHNNLYLHNYKLDEDIIREALSRFNNDEDLFKEITVTQTLSESFIREYKDIINWSYVCEYQKLSNDFMVEYNEYLDWDIVIKWQELKDSFIEQFRDNFDMDDIIKYQKISEKLIHKFAGELDWGHLLITVHLSEKFLIDHFDYYKDSNNMISTILVRNLSPSFTEMLERQKSENWKNLAQYFSK